VPVYRFLFRPAWLLSHLLVVLLVITMISLGFWQLRRLDEKQELNAVIEDRAELATVPITDLIDPDADFAEGDSVEYRQVQVTGIYQADDEVLIHNRTLNGSPGRWALTPLLLDDGTAVVVNRGWVPFAMMPGEPRPGTEPPTGEVTVVGAARSTTTRSGIGTSDPSAGVLDAMSRPDLGRLQQQLDYDVYPVLIQMESQVPEQESGLPVPLELPELSEGPHLGYAAQWFIFALIAIIGYPLILRRVAHGKAKAKASDEADAAATVPS
jgi:surfeit locus 1 family protein